MAYATQDDLLVRLGGEEIVQLTDDTRSGTVNATVVGDILDEASAQVDSYCRTRYQTPLQACDDATRITRDIAVYLLYSRRPQKIPDAVRQRYEDSVSFLKDVSTGKASLDQPAGASTPQTAVGGPVTVCREERFSERNIEGYC